MTLVARHPAYWRQPTGMPQSECPCPAGIRWSQKRRDTAFVIILDDLDDTTFDMLARLVELFGVDQ